MSADVVSLLSDYSRRMDKQAVIFLSSFLPNIKLRQQDHVIEERTGWNGKQYAMDFVPEFGTEVNLDEWIPVDLCGHRFYNDGDMDLGVVWYNIHLRASDESWETLDNVRTLFENKWHVVTRYFNEQDTALQEYWNPTPAHERLNLIFRPDHEDDFQPYIESDNDVMEIDVIDLTDD